MSFDWQGYYDLAKVLSERDDEASLRSAMSRAYYAAFHSAQMKVKQRDPSLVRAEGQGSHEVVWRWYKEQRNNRTMTQIGVWGFRLKDERVAADYRADSPIDANRAKDALDEASNILRRLASI